MQSLEEKAKELRNEYYKNWRARNPSKYKDSIKKYWLKKAEKELEQEKKKI